MRVFSGLVLVVMIGCGAPTVVVTTADAPPADVDEADDDVDDVDDGVGGDPATPDHGAIDDGAYDDGAYDDGAGAPGADDDAPGDATPIAPDEGAEPVARAFVGAACADDDGCLDGGFCLDDGAGFPHGACSVSCTRLCPDDASAPTTFCVDDPAGADGLCVSRCDVPRLGGDGCREGYRCVAQPRHDEPGVVRDVCWPDGLGLPAPLPPTTPPPPPATDGDDDVCTEADLPLDNAGLTEPPGVGGCPAGMAPIAGTTVCMDRWEAFLEERTAAGDVVPFSPYRHPGAAVVVARSAPGAVPQGYISGHEAKAACARAGKRLCREREWSLGCGGEAGFVYPWGNDRRDGVCNDARARHPAVEYFGTAADWIWSRLGHPCINQLDDSVARTGEHPGCASPSGHVDLMGNLHEWVDDPAGTFRGGFYVDTVRNGAGCAYRTTAHDLGHWDYSTGFRCCADR